MGLASKPNQSSSTVEYRPRKSRLGTKSPCSKSLAFLDGYSPYWPPLTFWPMTKETPRHPATTYKAKDPDKSIRIVRQEVIDAVGKAGLGLVDVRSPKEFSGEILAPENLPQEGAQRGGHIPGAANIPWSQAVREDGTFKSAEDLKQLYQGKGIVPDKEIIAYCRIGERSSHTWFVLKYLLGYPKVLNYDGSWTEYGSLVHVPIEK